MDFNEELLKIENHFLNYSTELKYIEIGRIPSEKNFVWKTYERVIDVAHKFLLKASPYYLYVNIYYKEERYYGDGKVYMARGYIPFEKIKSLELRVENGSHYVPGINVTVQKSPVKGAIVGGLVAGPTGAVVGAIANQGTVTKNSLGRTIYDYTDILDITFTDGERAIISIPSHKTSNVDYAYAANSFNVYASTYINTARIPHTADDEIKVLSKALKEKRKENTSYIIYIIITIIVIIVVFGIISIYTWLWS